MSDERTDDPAAIPDGAERLAELEAAPLAERAPRYTAIADELRDVLESADRDEG